MTLRAYFDASTLDEGGGKVLAVAGYLWSFDQWKKAQKAWRKVLKKNSLEFFHMTDFESFKGPYEQWTPHQHVAVFRRLASIVTATASLGIGTGVVLGDYDVLDNESKSMLSTPYSLAGSWCLGAVARWLEDRGVSEEVDYVFERGDAHQHYLGEAIMELSKSATFKETFRVGSFHFEDKRRIPVLQAADILAYETCKQALRNLGLTARPIRKSLIALLEGDLQYASELFNLDAMKRLASKKLWPGDRVEILRHEIKADFKQLRSGK